MKLCSERPFVLISVYAGKSDSTMLRGWLRGVSYLLRFATIRRYSPLFALFVLFAIRGYIAIRVFQTPLPLSVNAFKAHELEIYSNVAALPRRADSDVSLLFRKIDINRSAVDISTCLHLSEWVTNSHILTPNNSRYNASRIHAKS